tara:strand:- start:2532 stop:2858 length:327 start_codon:yes stop_codon:yes gene_type:complete
LINFTIQKYNKNNQGDESPLLKLNKMRKLITKETYSSLNGELYKLTGKDVIVKPHLKYPEDGDIIWNYEILIDGKREYLTRGHLTRVRKDFWKYYREQSWLRVWKYEK